MMNRVIPIAAAFSWPLLIGGCAGVPQMASAPPSPTRECFDARAKEASLDVIRSKMVLVLEHPTLDMQADKTFPTVAERAAILAYAQIREVCFNAGEGWVQKYVPPTYRAIGEYGRRTIDADLAALYRSDITFGEYNVRLEATRSEGRRRSDEVREIEQRETDATRRQAALALMLAAQPAARPAPTPVSNSYTSCNRVGDQMYCTTNTR